MKFKKHVKFALPALLLAVGATAFADDSAIVTLANGGGNITWADFVKAITNPDEVEGDIAKVPNNNNYPAKRAYTTALNAKNTAEAALTAAQDKEKEAQDAKNEADEAVTAAQGVVDAKTTAYNTAKQASVDAQTTVTADSTALETAEAQLKTAQDAYIKDRQDALDAAQSQLAPAEEKLKEAQAAYIQTYQTKLDDANKQLAQKETSRDHYVTTDSTNYAKNVADLKASLTTATNTLRTLQNSSTLAKKETTGPAKWLTDIISTASKFQQAYSSSTVETTPVVWFAISEGRDGTTLYFSFTTDKPDYSIEDSTTPWTQITGDGFYDQFVKSGGKYTTTTIDYVDIYMGTAYEEKAGSFLYPISSLTASSNKNTYCKTISNTLSNLSADTRFFVTTTTDEYKDPTAANATLAEIESVKTEYTNDYKALNGWHSTSSSFTIPSVNVVVSWKEGDTEVIGAQEQLNEVTETLKNLRSDIKTLKLETIPGYEKELKEAEAAVENGTAVSEAITAANNAVSAANTAITNAQTALDNANTAVENGTATSEAITAANNAISEAKTKLEASRAALASAQTTEKNAQGELATAQSELEEKTGLQTTAQTNLTDASGKVTQAQADLDAKQQALETAEEDAQHEANTYAYNQYYGEITLNGDITSDPTGANYSGTIMGNDKIINVTSGNLFNRFSGHIDNAIINGSIASILTSTTGAQASFTDVAVWTGTGENPGRFYDEDGVRTYFTEIFALGNKARSLCGIDPTAKKLVALSANSRVYSITEMPASAADRKTYFAVVGENGLVGTNGAITLPTNTFALAATSDFGDVTGVSNVYYADEAGNNICNDVVIVDGQNFYAPANIKAAEVTYNREFKEGMNTVCLPFELSTDLAEEIRFVCEYDREADNKFWFTAVAEGETIEANKPALIVGKEGATPFKLNLSNVTIEATDEQIIADACKHDGDNSVCYGNLKRVAAGQFSGQYDLEQGNMFGLSGGEFKPAGNSATFPAFRAVLKRNTLAAEPSNAPRKIGIRDQFGNDITDLETTGVEDVTSEFAELNIIGGQGVIKFEADADYGMVQIYAIDGKVAAAVEVFEGSTSVSLQKGIYIVMGKKVMVK